MLTKNYPLVVKMGPQKENLEPLYQVSHMLIFL